MKVVYFYFFMLFIILLIGLTLSQFNTFKTIEMIKVQNTKILEQLDTYHPHHKSKSEIKMKSHNITISE